MSRKKKTFPIYNNVPVSAIAAEGRALVRVDDLVIFVPFVVPGDIIDLQVTRKKNKYCEGQAVNLHVRGNDRVEPFCKYFGVCGGCRWQCLSYDKQLFWKQRIVEDALNRIAKIELPPFMPIIGSDMTQKYRNKLEFGFSNKRWLTRHEIEKNIEYDNMNAAGFHVPGAFDKIIDIDECLLMDDIQNDLRNEVRDFAIKNGLTFFDIRNSRGLLRNMMVRKTLTGETMLLLQLRYENADDETAANSLLEHIKNRFPSLTSLLYVNNLKCNDTFGDLEVKTYAGRDYIYEQMGDLRFKIGPKSFFQTNTAQALRLYNTVRQFAALTGKELVYDLYTGTGTIANFVARLAKRVIGIEYVPEAIDDANENAALNGITNVEFYAGDMQKILTGDFIASKGAPDVIITDPPRAGMHKDVVATILSTKARKIIYVSCNPATQARDLTLLDELYKVCAVQPVDMFPQTQHVENVCLLVLR